MKKGAQVCECYVQQSPPHYDAQKDVSTTTENENGSTASVVLSRMKGATNTRIAQQPPFAYVRWRRHAPDPFGSTRGGRMYRSTGMVLLSDQFGKKIRRLPHFFATFIGSTQKRALFHHEWIR